MIQELKRCNHMHSVTVQLRCWGVIKVKYHLFRTKSRQMHSHISSAALYKWKLLSSSGNGRGNLNMEFRLAFSADHSTFTRSVSASSLFIIKASAQVWSISVGGRMAAVFGYHLSHGLPCLNAFDFGIAVLWLTRSLTAVCFYLSTISSHHFSCWMLWQSGSQF